MTIVGGEAGLVKVIEHRADAGECREQAGGETTMGSFFVRSLFHGSFRSWFFPFRVQWLIAPSFTPGTSP
jgi:hypothetical protein